MVLLDGQGPSHVLLGGTWSGILNHLIIIHSFICIQAHINVNSMTKYYNNVSVTVSTIEKLGHSSFH